MEKCRILGEELEAANQVKNSAVETENHVKHGARSKCHTSRGIFLRCLWFALLSAFMFVGCGDNDPEEYDDEILYEFGIEKGKVSYRETTFNPGQDDDVQYFTMTFDKKGKLFRLSFGSIVYIDDAIANKFYQINTFTETYTESDYSGIMALYLYHGDHEWQSPAYAHFTKEDNKTVAGKNCTVYSWSSSGLRVEWGGWNRILFWNQPRTDNDRLEATSFSEEIDADSFTVPPGYEKVTSFH